MDCIAWIVCSLSVHNVWGCGRTSTPTVSCSSFLSLFVFFLSSSRTERLCSLISLCYLWIAFCMLFSAIFLFCVSAYCCMLFADYSYSLIFFSLCENYRNILILCVNREWMLMDFSFWNSVCGLAFPYWVFVIVQYKENKIKLWSININFLNFFLP